MDNIVVIKIDGIEYEFKLKSSNILYLEKRLGVNIFDAFQHPNFTIVANIFYTCSSNQCKLKYKNEGELFDALLGEYSMEDLIEKYLQDIVDKSGLVQKQKTSTPSRENKEKTWNK